MNFFTDFCYLTCPIGSACLRLGDSTAPFTVYEFVVIPLLFTIVHHITRPSKMFFPSECVHLHQLRVHVAIPNLIWNGFYRCRLDTDQPRAGKPYGAGYYFMYA